MQQRDRLVFLLIDDAPECGAIGRGGVGVFGEGERRECGRARPKPTTGWRCDLIDWRNVVAIHVIPLKL
ncbi:MAG: hypothetical protein M0D54_15640 [Hyphomonadaceae bacterium JAD_PAG50586_4]|nr:MAG: hypothetical protein M0D54_15640 [Hyphomonadaceae bacterium JAD_PAG50586_4]